MSTLDLKESQFHVPETRDTRWFILVILVNSGEAKKNIYIFVPEEFKFLS